MGLSMSYFIKFMHGYSFSSYYDKENVCLYVCQQNRKKMLKNGPLTNDEKNLVLPISDASHKCAIVGY